MLKRLTISNLAIIENADLTLGEGFSVLTGATGAGKSLVIDSLSLLLGARASSELIRSGEEKATIKGEFAVRNARLDALLSSLDIPLLDDVVLVERIISKTKNVVKINNVVVTLSDLSQAAKFLADIHNQFDFQKILNPENYLDIVDGFAYELLAPFKKDYALAYQNYREKEKELAELQAKKKKIEENQDFYRYQYDELKGANLRAGEEEELEDSLSLLRNYDKIYSLSQEVNALVHDDFLDKLYELKKTIAKLGSFQSQYNEYSDLLDEKYYELEDLFSTLKKSFDGLDYDPNSLEELMQRQSDLASLQRKYKKPIPELIAYRDELSSLLKQQTSIDGDIQLKEEECGEAKKALIQKGNELTTVRKRVAKSIEKELMQNLKDLMLNVRFEIEFKSHEGEYINESGFDEIDFLIETNIGEGLKPMAKIISGGEASRIMLALKAIFVKANKVSTVIFDEIDTGISGEAAQAVAMKIKEMSFARQVIAITHLPQVASCSDHHILIEKEVRKERTFVKIQELSLEEKIEEVAHLISGKKVTESQLAYAREMVLSNLS